ncbi:hypothetical protein B566_EDAN002124 [Ephemera danica]|nr:hypothetical protein B566_EDAN002124 [Ephemera danica]
MYNHSIAFPFLTLLSFKSVVTALHCVHHHGIGLKLEMKREACAATVNRQPSATRAPASGRCNCNCALHHNDPVCAVNSRGERDTFVNQCQLECHNCTSRDNYRIVLRKACS